jgi:hypothetical protein
VITGSCIFLSGQKFLCVIYIYIYAHILTSLNTSSNFAPLIHCLCIGIHLYSLATRNFIIKFIISFMNIEICKDVCL